MSTPPRRRTVLTAALAAASLLLAGAGGVSAVRLSAEQDRQQARQAQEQEELARHRDAVTVLLSDAEFVLEPLFLADLYDGEVGDQVRVDVYRFGETARDLDELRAQLSRLPASGPASRALSDAVDARLREAMEASERLASVDRGPADWSGDVAALSGVRDGWRQALRDASPGMTAPVPSLGATTLTATRASSLLRYDSACDSAFVRLPDAPPRTAEELAGVVEELSDSFSFAAGAVQYVEVPGYEQTVVENDVRLPAMELRERLEVVETEVRRAAEAGEQAAFTRALREFAGLDELVKKIGTGLVTYGAHVCADYFGVPLPPGAEPPEPPESPEPRPA